MWEVIVHTAQIVVPAYIANAAPTFLVKLKKHPIDFGKKWKGKRILGDGKTIEGLVFAVIVAYISGLVELWLISKFNYQFLTIPVWGFALIGLGAMIGDMTGSFIKRRKNMKRGENAGLLDMEDFMVGTLIAARIVVNYSIWVVVISLLITPIIHRTANIIGYKIGVKKEPW